MPHPSFLSVADVRDRHDVGRVRAAGPGHDFAREPGAIAAQDRCIGIGIGLRSAHYAHILDADPVVDWFEILSDNYMIDGGRPLRVLDAILERYPVVQHGVGLYPGSAQGLDRDYLVRLKALARRTRTPWISDHLCWGSVDGTFSHDLLPLPYTTEVARLTARHLREAQDFLEVPLLVENLSSYAEFRHNTMTEWEFLTAVVEEAGCGILLDVNNIFVSSVNHGFDPFEYLANIPHERVKQLHVAGHSRHERFILDTHDREVSDAVWDLYARAIEVCGPLPTLLEWDERIPAFDVVHAEARKAARWLDAQEAPAARPAVGATGARQACGAPDAQECARA